MTEFSQQPSPEGRLQHQISALFSLLGCIYSKDKLTAKASKLKALQLMRSPEPQDRLLALERLVFEDSSIKEDSQEDIFGRIGKLEEIIADLVARRKIADELEHKVAQRVQERHDEYIKELTLEIIREGSPDNAHTLKKYAHLQKLENRQLSRSTLEMLRPNQLVDVVGQQRSIRALLAKIASPYPQHILIYGPPGVGKTTVARLALEHASKLPHTPFCSEAPFVEVDGTTIRWDPREVSNPLLGSVHDPIYQGARREMADGAIPEPKLGLVTQAHGGVLFIDEIGELELLLQNKLLKVLEDKRVSFDSPYYDPDDPNVPKYIKLLFEKGAPADFLLIGATTKQPEEINPALRSRCAEIFFEPLTPNDIETIVNNAAARLNVQLEDTIAPIIAQHTVEGRKAVGLLADAYGLATYSGHDYINQAHVEEVLCAGRISPYARARTDGEPEVGKVFGLAVSGFLGALLEIEAIAFTPHNSGAGTIRFNDTAGSMAKDSVFNATSLIRSLTGHDLSDFDIHVNVIGGAHIDGPSAGAAILAASISAIKGIPLRQDVAITGEVSILGKMKAVGGIPEKIYGARQAGIKNVIIPQENLKDVPADVQGVSIIPVKRVEEMLSHILAEPLDFPTNNQMIRNIPLSKHRAISG